MDFFRTNNAPCTAFADAGGVKLHFLFLLRLPQRNQHAQLKPTLAGRNCRGTAVFCGSVLYAFYTEAMVQDILFRRDGQALLKFQLTVKAVFNADGCKAFLPRHAQVDEPALRVCDFVVLSIALSSALPNRLLMSITSIKSSAVPSATQVN